MEPEAKKKNNKKTPDKLKLLRSIAALAAIIALIAGITYAWFFNQMDMATLMEIQPPSAISILGPNGTQLDSLDLSYTESQKNDGKITIKRAFCVQSTDKFNLEIVHTTNLKGLEFKLYPATQLESSDADSKGREFITDGGYKYAYSSKASVKGDYLNLSKTEVGTYKYASSTYHSDNYGAYDKVQTHAEPVYWLATDNLVPSDGTIELPDQTGEIKYFHRTYFVCEVSWTETTKETDIFYILAKNA